jgi:nucleotide-binding universal stress UspA family protein
MQRIEKSVSQHRQLPTPFLDYGAGNEGARWMKTSSSEQEPAKNISYPVTAKDLRQWCSPKLILAVTNVSDEEPLLFHVVNQARQNAAKVLLVYVPLPERSRSDACRAARQVRLLPSPKIAEAKLARMARQLRWVGIPCESIVLKGSPAEEIRFLVESRGVDRIIVTLQDKTDQRGPGSVSIAEEIMSGIGIPVCIIGRCVPSVSRSTRPSGRMTLALSLRSDSKVPLGFACRFAQERRAHLTVLHVFERPDQSAKTVDRTPVAIASRLLAAELREAELFCPLAITVREGDPASEILKYVSCMDQDFIILGSRGLPHGDKRESMSLVQRVVNETQCPVIILGRPA